MVTIDDRFVKLCARNGIGESHRVIAWEQISERYREPHRYYHNFDHIERMLGWFDRLECTKSEIEFAIWFHDVIYDPLAADNELRSALFFRETLGSLFPFWFGDRVESLILATDPRQKRSGDEAEDLLIDIDLSILGAKPKAYRSYAKKVRAEYVMIPTDRFARGRAGILRGLLADRIFATHYFSELEPLARENLKREIRELEGGSQTD